MQSGLPVARVELLDEVQMDALNQYSNLDSPKAYLFFEFRNTTLVEEQSQLVGELKNGGGSFRGLLMKQNERNSGMLDMMPTMQRWLSNRAVRVAYRLCPHFSTSKCIL